MRSHVLAVRHCESSGQAPEADLTPRGREQAETLALWLESWGVARIVSSPYARAVQTIAPFAQRRGLAIATDVRLAERSLSPEPIADWREFVERSFAQPHTRAPGGESGDEALARGWAALASALDVPGTLVASHGQLLSLVLHRIDARFGFAGWEAMTNPDVFRIERDPSGALRFERAWRAH